MIAFWLLVLIYSNMIYYINSEQSIKINPKLTKVWGPGLTPDKIIMPARYFFIQLYDVNNNSLTKSLKKEPKVIIDGATKQNKPCRIWTSILDKKDGSYIVRYKQYETCSYIKITIAVENELFPGSTFIINGPIYPDNCICPIKNINPLLKLWECGKVPLQITKQLDSFENINWNTQRSELINKFNKPHSVSLCHYIVKNNKIYRKCYGKYVGFNMFMDNILLSMTRKVFLPDIEFFSNLGDWPLSVKDMTEKFPIFSWCGSNNSYDITLPTYDITESTLENMGRVTLDILSVQGNVKQTFDEREDKLFWRGRDSNKHRLELIKISKQNPDLFNASLTNFFFYKSEEHIYGPKAQHVSFFDFFNYKYQLAIDGTVAPYRMPYLLGGGSLVFKPDSDYFEHFYKDLIPDYHYVPVKTDLADLVEKIRWAINNKAEAKRIAQNGKEFVNENLLPKNIFCYHFHLFNEFSKKITSKVEIFHDMEEIQQKVSTCECLTEKKEAKKDEL